MVTDELVRKSGAWLSALRDTGIVISSRVRLARNIRSASFPGWADASDCVRVSDIIRSAIESTPSIVNPVFFDMGKLEQVDKEVLKERHLISNELAEKAEGSGLVVAADERIAIMINEEDHLRLQVMSPGMNISSVWKRVDSVDSELSKVLEYAFSPRLGYLTACPSNVGTGMRASVMMHLAGLRMSNEIDPVIRALERLGLAVRGLLGEGTEANGDMFQVSNQITLGRTENDIVNQLSRIVEEVVRQEKNARARLMEDRRSHVLDRISRAFGTLLNARVLSSHEAVDLLSCLRFGVELGVVKNLPVAGINEIMLLTQPGHLQKISQKILSPEERDEKRADIARDRLKDVKMILATP